jgi:hypothetical protein
MTWSFRDFMAWMGSGNPYRGRVMPRPVPRPRGDLGSVRPQVVGHIETPGMISQPPAPRGGSRPTSSPPGVRGGYQPTAAGAPDGPPPAPPKDASAASRMKRSREEFITTTVHAMIRSGGYADWSADKLVLHAEVLWSRISGPES